jgi:DNA modification methylase
MTQRKTENATPAIHQSANYSVCEVGRDLTSTTSKRVTFNCKICGMHTDALVNTLRFTEGICRECFGKRKDKRKNALNDLSGSEWAANSKSVEEYEGLRSDKQKFHGACFPLSLALQQIKIYTKSGQTVFDPFAGVGTTLEAAEKLGRKAIGIELNPEFADYAKKDIKSSEDIKIYSADARNMLKYILPNSIDFILTSPPYGNLLKTVKGEFAYKWKEHSKLSPAKNPNPYSDNPMDLGNLSYTDFLNELSKIMSLTYSVLKGDCYSVWVVKDYRDLDNQRPLVTLHSDVMQSAERAGFILWDIKIYDQTRFRPLVVLGYPSRNYYLNIGHSYVLIFKKSV